MRFSSILTLAAAASSAVAQRPEGTSICDYYTTALLKTNNATNQMTLLTLVVNTAVIGNYTMPNVGITVPGILANGTYNGTAVDLLQYFDGSLMSSNRGGSSGVSINFLDDGGAAPLKLNMPANGTTSNQYKLLTHLYEYFGLLLGCSDVGMTGYPAYTGQTSMYNVHKFMALSNAEFGYFVTQVGLSAASFGVAQSDVTAVGMALSNAFGYKCEPSAMIIPNTTAELQSICSDADCPLAPNATCAAYATVMEPNSTASNGSANGTKTGSSGSSSTAKSASTAIRPIVELVLGFSAVIAFIL